jgi:hypothetical protein
MVTGSFSHKDTYSIYLRNLVISFISYQEAMLFGKLDLLNRLATSFCR